MMMAATREDFGDRNSAKTACEHAPPSPTITQHAACSQAGRGGRWDGIKAPVWPVFVQDHGSAEVPLLLLLLGSSRKKGTSRPGFFFRTRRGHAGDKGHERSLFCCIRRPRVARKCLNKLTSFYHQQHREELAQQGLQKAKQWAGGRQTRGGHMEQDKTLLLVCDKAEEECWRVVSTVRTSAGARRDGAVVLRRYAWLRPPPLPPRLIPSPSDTYSCLRLHISHTHSSRSISPRRSLDWRAWTSSSRTCSTNWRGNAD